MVLLVVFGLVGLNLWQAGRVSMMKEILVESQEREGELNRNIILRIERTEKALTRAVSLAQTTENALTTEQGWFNEAVETPWRWYRRMKDTLKTEWAGLAAPPGVVGIGGPEGEDDERGTETDETDFAGRDAGADTAEAP